MSGLWSAEPSVSAFHIIAWPENGLVFSELGRNKRDLLAVVTCYRNRRAAETVGWRWLVDPGWDV